MQGPGWASSSQFRPDSPGISGPSTALCSQRRRRSCGVGQRAWGGALLWLPASSGGQDAWSAVPAVTAVATHPCWEVGPGGAGLFTAAPLVLTRSRGPAGITPQTRFRGPAAGLSDPPGKRWAGVTPEGLMLLLGLTLPPGDHARGLPAWLRPPSTGLEGTLGGGCLTPPHPHPGWAPGRAGPWESCPALPLGVGIGGGRTRDPTRCCPLSWVGEMTLRGSRSLPELQAPGG